MDNLFVIFELGETTFISRILDALYVSRRVILNKL